MAITIYGIENCDTMKKARAWLEDNDIAHGFSDITFFKLPDAD